MSKPLAMLFAEQNKIIEKLIEGDGEISSELEIEMKDLAAITEAKTDGYYLILERLESESLFFKTRADEFTTASKTLSNAHFRIKARLKDLMQQNDFQELIGHDYKFKLSASKPSVIINNEDLIPSEYKTEVTTIQIDKNKISEDLRIGVPVSGASLQESFALRSSVIKSLKGKTNAKI